MTSKKIRFVCSRPGCEIPGERYPSQIRNPNRLYCSQECKWIDDSRFSQGEDNHNYRHGKYISPTCDCGAVKDARSHNCAVCAKRGYVTGTKRTIAEMLTKGTSRNGDIRRQVLKYNLIEYLCLICGLGPTWQDNELVLQLDHTNGNPADDRLENLRFLCPNCHSQTDTYASKNKQKHKELRANGDLLCR